MNPSVAGCTGVCAMTCPRPVSTATCRQGDLSESSCEGARCLCHGGPEMRQHGHLRVRCAWFRSQQRSHLPRLHVLMCDSQRSTI